MSIAAEAPTVSFSHRHLLGIEGLSRAEIIALRTGQGAPSLRDSDGPIHRG